MMVLVCWPLGVLHFVQGIASLMPVILIITVKFAWDPVLSYCTCTLNISFNETLEWLNAYGVPHVIKKIALKKMST